VTSSILSSQNDLTYTTANTRSPRNNVILAYSGSSCGSESSQCPRVAWEAPLRHTLQGQSWTWLLLSFPERVRKAMLSLHISVPLSHRDLWKVDSLSGKRLMTRRRQHEAHTRMCGLVHPEPTSRRRPSNRSLIQK
jgi:hypothetical protein